MAFLSLNTVGEHEIANPLPQVAELPAVREVVDSGNSAQLFAEVLSRVGEDSILYISKKESRDFNSYHDDFFAVRTWQIPTNFGSGTT